MMTAATTTNPAASNEEVRWIKCPSCDAFVYAKRLERNLRVCPECNFHMAIPLRRRLQILCDADSFTVLSDDLVPQDVLGFVDTKPYGVRIREAQAAVGSNEAGVYGTATIGGYPIVIAGIDFAFMGGSMSGAVGEAVTRAAELALETRTPLLVISASGGARMQEGCISLMQLAKTSQAIGRLAEEGVLYISLLTDPTYGGVSASFASLGDVLIAEPKSRIGFAGKQIIEQTLRQKLPEGFQTAEFLLEHGMLDLVEPRENLRNVLRKLLALHKQHEVAALQPGEGRAPITDPAELTRGDVWESIQAAREIDRPNAQDYISHIFDDYVDLKGDRLFREDAAITGGPAKLGDLTVMVIAHQKGHTTSEMVERNFGMANPEGYNKALRLMQYAARFHMPVVTLVDTPGAFPGIGAEERGQSNAIARCIMEMSRLPVPLVTVVTGEGGSGGALALAVADRVMMLQNAYYSVITPESCSIILFKSAASAPQAAASLRIVAPDLLELGVVDAVVPEPEGGAHTDHVAAAANLRAAIVTGLNQLLGKSSAELLEERYARFRAYGVPGKQRMLSHAEGKA